MNRRSLRPVCQVAVSHTFFSSGICTALRLAPTDSCVRELRALDLQWQQNADGGTLHAWIEDTDELAHSKAVRLASAAPLCFHLHCDDRDFAKYTNLTQAPGTLDGAMSSLYCSNALSAAGGLDALHPNKAAGDSWIVWDERPRIIMNGASRLSITYANGAEVDHASSATPELDMARLAEGRYRITENGEPMLDRWFSRSYRRDVLGAVELFLFKDEQQTAREFAFRSYTIRFEARSTRWRYHIVPKSLQSLTDSEVRLEGEQVFQRIGSSTINGAECVTFESDTPIPLDDNGHRARVVVLEDTSGRDRAREIPLPTPRGTRCEWVPEPRWVSEVIAYV